MTAGGARYTNRLVREVNCERAPAFLCACLRRGRRLATRLTCRQAPGPRGRDGSIPSTWSDSPWTRWIYPVDTVLEPIDTVLEPVDTFMERVHTFRDPVYTVLQLVNT